MSYNNIAVAYFSIEKYEESLEWIHKALEIQENILGKKHPSMKYIYTNIGSLYYSQEKYKEASGFLCKAAIIGIANGLFKRPYSEIPLKNLQECFIRAGSKEEKFECWLDEQIAIYMQSDI